MYCHSTPFDLYILEYCLTEQNQFNLKLTGTV